MSTNTKAEELATALTRADAVAIQLTTRKDVAAELRRLAAVEAERDTIAERLSVAEELAAQYLADRDALKQTLYDELDGNLRLRDLGGARQNEGMTGFMERVFAERDRLAAEVEALRADAERYRWLVSRPLDGGDEFHIVVKDNGQAYDDGFWAIGGDMPKEQADRYIDAAMEIGLAGVEVSDSNFGAWLEAGGDDRR